MDSHKKFAEEYDLSYPLLADTDKKLAKKFDVVNRKRLQKLLKEIELGKGEYGNKEKCVQAGKMLNAEYVLTTGIKAIYFRNDSERVPYTNMKKNRLLARIDLNCRISETKTSRIVFARSINVSTEVKLEPREELFWAAERDQLFDNIYDVTARTVADAALESIFPMKIVTKKDKNLYYINRGKGLVEKGEKYNVYRPGEDLKDPDTGEVLGTAEKKVGVLKINRVFPEKAVAKALSGDFKRGDLCREQTESLKKRTSVEPKQKLNW